VNVTSCIGFRPPRTARPFRLRTGEPPLVFGTSCVVVNSVSLPTGWEGTCLEYTLGGRRVHGRFSYGTSSVTAFPGAPPSDSPGAALAAAHGGDREFAQELMGGMVVVYADEVAVDLQARSRRASSAGHTQCLGSWRKAGSLIGRVRPRRAGLNPPESRTPAINNPGNSRGKPWPRWVSYRMTQSCLIR